MKNVLFALNLGYIVACLSCYDKTGNYSKPFFDANGKKVGDSIFRDHLIDKIVFTDSTYEIDSLVFSRYENAGKTLKAVNTYFNGKQVYENVNYYENGQVGRYKFIGEQDTACFYERWYHTNGDFMQSRGRPFFQGIVVDTTGSKRMEMRKGTSTAYRIYYPNPPDCTTRMYVTDDDAEEKVDVFHKSTFLNFLLTTWGDNKREGFFKSTFLLEMIDQNADTMRCSHDFIFEVAAY